MADELNEGVLGQHRELLLERIDPDSGLLDILLANKTLSRGEIREIRAKDPHDKRNAALLDLIMDKRQCNGLVKALKETKQLHLVNYLNADAQYRPEFKDDWPLTEKETSILDANQRILVDLIDLSDLVGRLHSRGVINSRQREAISAEKTSYQRNEVFLEILSRRCVRDFKNTIRCLIESNQEHIAEILDNGGVVAKVHAEGLDDKTEDEIIAVIQRLLNNKSREVSLNILEQTKLRVISAKKGESVVLYVYCKTAIQIIQLKEMQIKGELKTAVERLFEKLLTPLQNVDVKAENSEIPAELLHDLQQRRSKLNGMTVTLSEHEYKRCRSYFPDMKLRAVFDFDPEEMTKQQEIELENISRSKIISLKGKGHTHVKFKMNANKGQQEESSHRNVTTEKPEVGDGMLDGDQSKEAHRTRKVEEQKLKESSEGENVMETEKEREELDSIEFDVETIHEPTTNLLEDHLEEERQFHPNEKESKPELKELEDVSETESENSEISSAESEERLNSFKMAFSFKKGDLMETVLPADIGDTITWWKAIHLESREVGYVLRRLVVIDYQTHFDQDFETLTATSQIEYLKSATSNTSMSNLPLELFDSILRKSYLLRVLREEQILKNKDHQTISQLASVDCCWFQRIRRRKFKKELWRSLFVFYRSKEKISSIYRINRKYLEENIQLQGLVKRLKSNDCLTDFQTASLYRQRVPLGRKDSFSRFKDLTSEVLEKKEAIQSVFRRCLCDTKQHLVAEVIENGGGMMKIEITLPKANTSLKTRDQNLEIVAKINELRDKTKAKSHEIEELMGELKQDNLEMVSACRDGRTVVVWIWCKTNHALERLKTMNNSRHITDVFNDLVKNLSFSSEDRNRAIAKPKVNIDFEQFEKTVVFFSIVANFISRLNLERAKDEEVLDLDLRRRREDVGVWGVTKLRNKFHVLLLYYSAPRCVILVFEDQIPFRLQKRIKLKKIKIPRDIVSIEMENSLYVLGVGFDLSECIWKIKEGDEKEKLEKISIWLELRDYSVDPKTLSVTRDGQLMLISRRKDDPLWYLRLFGEVESEKADFRLSISLPKDFESPWHAIETFRGNFIILHEIRKREGDWRQMVESEVSGDGKTILRRFIPKNEEQKLRLLFGLCFGYLAVDSLDRVFLADNEKDRVILFDSDLQWNGILIPTEEDRKQGRSTQRPRRLFYDEEKKQLIVGGEAELFVYTLNRK